MVDIAKLKSENAHRWSTMGVKHTLIQAFDIVAHKLLSGKIRYVSVSGATKVPWYVIAVIHERESSQSWLASLAQGDPFNHVSIHVPRGRGPFDSWEAAAVDALERCPPFAARWTDWSIGGLLTLLEEYNGFGYAVHGRPSPYVWAGTNEYVSGKYIADGHYDPNAVDHQLGCAGLLSRMAAADSTIKLGEGT